MNARSPYALLLIALASSLLAAGTLRAQSLSFVRLPAPSHDADRFVALAIDAGDRLYAHLGSTTYISTDHGDTWTPGGSIDGEVRIIKVDPAGRLVAGTWHGAGLFRSADNGASWQRVGNVPETIWDIAFNAQGHIFLATEGRRVMRSTNNGSTWRQVGSEDMGIFIWGIGVDSAGSVLAGGQGSGIYRSTDNGATWSERLGGFVITGFLTDPSGIYYAATEGAGLYRSTDHGLTWARRTLTTPQIEQGLTIAGVMASDGGGRAYVAARNYLASGSWSAIFITTDGGEHWVMSDTGFGGALNGVVADARGYLYTYTDRGIFRSAASLASIDRDERSAAAHVSIIPNPAREDLLLSFTLEERSTTHLAITDVRGREVAVPLAGPLEAGEHRVAWHPGALPDGVYFYRLTLGERSQSGKIIVRR